MLYPDTPDIVTFIVFAVNYNFIFFNPHTLDIIFIVFSTNA